jgi:putative Mn2+ efflux pump MntP
MDAINLFVVAIGLAMDCFAVSLGVGAGGQAKTLRPRFRLSFHMGLFQGGMTLLSWLAGSTVVHLIASVDHWIAMGLLAFVGIRMVRSGLSSADEGCTGDPTRGGQLVIVSVATSIDALAVGLSLAFLEVNILASSLIIGVVSSLFSVIGLVAGNRLGECFGKRMEVIGGLLLNGIGLRILISHLL